MIMVMYEILICNDPGEGRLDRAGLQEAFLSVGVESVDQMVRADIKHHSILSIP